MKNILNHDLNENKILYIRLEAFFDSILQEKVLKMSNSLHKDFFLVKVYANTQH